MNESPSLNEEIQKGKCVQNQLKIWEKLLETRIKFQKVLTTANSFPDFDAHLDLISLDDQRFAEAAENVSENIHKLLDNFFELQEHLVGR